MIARKTYKKEKAETPDNQCDCQDRNEKKCCNEKEITAIFEELAKDLPPNPSLDQVKLLIIKCILEQFPAVNDIPNCDQVKSWAKEVAEACISVIEFPESVTAAESKQIAQSCVDLLPEILGQSEVNNLIYQALLESSYISAEQAKVLIDTCISKLVIPSPRSDEEIQVIAKDIAEICIAAINLPTPRTDEEIAQIAQSIVDQSAVSDNHIKLIALQCFVDNEKQTLTPIEVKEMINSCIDLIVFPEGLSPEDVNSLIQTYLSAFNFVEEEEVKAIAQACVESGIVTPEQVKLLIVECLKELPAFQAGEVVDIDTECVNGIFRIVLTKGDNSQEISTTDLSKFVDDQSLVNIEQVKAITQECISSASNDSRFCLTNLTVNYDNVTGMLTTSVMDSCGTHSDSEILPMPVSEADIRVIIQELIDQNSSRFCNSSLSIDFESTTGLLTASVTDECGTQSNSTVITVTGTGNGGITSEQAKLIALQCIQDNQQTFTPRSDLEIIDLANQQINLNANGFIGFTESKQIAQSCVDDAVNDPRFCNSSFSLNLSGTVLTGSVTDNCGTQSDSQDIAAILSGGSTNQNLTHSVNGNDVTLSLSQTNGANVTETFTIPEQRTDAQVKAIAQDCFDNNGLCCNETITQTIQGTSLTTTITQSAGGDVIATTDLLPIFADLIACSEQLDTDGCSSYNSFTFNGVELCKLPIYEPKECCTEKCKTVVANETVTVSLESNNGFTVDWGDGTSSNTASSALTSLDHTYTTADTYKIKICQADPCFEALNFDIQPRTGLEAHSGCGC